MPTFFASGTSSLSRSSCWSTGATSEVPVTLAPGASSESISSADTGSVTAVNRTGVSWMFCAVACAAGVATDSTRSRSSPANPCAMVRAVDCSPLAFCSSNSTSTPASSKASLKPAVAASSAGCWTSWLMPIL